MTMQASSVASRPDIGRRLDRWILKRGLRKGWPLLALNLIEARRMFWGAGRPRAGHPVTRADFVDREWRMFIPRDQGYRLFGPNTFQELAEIVEACRSIFERHRNEVADIEAYNKPYFFNIMDADDLRNNPVLLNFALSQPVTRAVSSYLGHVPRLHSMGVFYSAVNDSIDGSQMYHVDGDALSQMKCFVNIWDVEQGGGAFTFLPRHSTPRRFRHGGLLKTLSDATVMTAVPEADQIAVTGKSGSGVFVDTSRCLHQGSRARERPRLVFQFQYLSRPDALLEVPDARPARGGHLRIGRRLLAGMAVTEDPAAMIFVD